VALEVTKKYRWRNVHPKLGQSVVVIMRDDDVALQIITLDGVYIDYQGWHVPVRRTIEQSIAHWRWRLNVK